MTEYVIYVVHQGYDEETLPIVPIDGVDEIAFMLKHGVMWNADPIDTENTPELLNLFRPTSTKGKENLFFDCHYRSDAVGITLPDIFAISFSTIVSKRFRDVILNVDADGSHDFIPTRVLNNHGEPVNDTEYYHLWCGRRVSTNIPTPRVDQKREEPSGPKFRTTLSNASFAVYQLNDLELMRYLCHVPVWVFAIMGCTLYISQEVFAALKSAKLSGLEEFTTRGGFNAVDAKGNYLTSREFVGHIFVDD